MRAASMPLAPSSADARDAAPAVIEMAGVRKWYGDFEVLRGIDLSVAPGERVVICGPSGSGKSTLIRCINRLEAHQAGRIRVCGTEVTEHLRSLERIAQQVGMVFQQFNLFPHLTALENCMLAPMRVKKMRRREAEELARLYLGRVHLLDHAGKCPHQLSGGQQQRVAIARSLCMSPKIMLFDEPTSALDPELIKEVLEVMVGLAGDGMTMLCVTHEMGFARTMADRILFMDAGRILEQAAPREFFSAPSTPRARLFLGHLSRH
jgi:general L-amino acid transport system ATP-binding protein